MNFLDFALGELKCGRLPWVHWSVWLGTIASAVFILACMVAGWYVGISLDNIIHDKVMECRGWVNV